MTAKPFPAKPICAPLAALALLGGCGGGGSSPTPTPTPSVAVNQPPIANAGANESRVERDLIRLDASDSSDSDGTIASFAWRQVAGPSVAINDADTAAANFDAPVVTAATEIRIALDVTDNDGATATDEITFTITPDPIDDAPRIQLTQDGEARIYILYTPSNFVPGNPAYLLLHGGGGNAQTVLNPPRTTRRWVDFAQRDGAVLIVPNGFNQRTGSGLGDEQSWNDIRPDDSGRTSQQDDAAFLLQVLDDAKTRADYDQGEVYIAGTSNGGIMTMTMLIEHPQRFRAGAAFIASLPLTDVPAPPSSTPFFMQNGTEDPLIQFGGGDVGNGGSATRPVLDTVDFWLDATGADRSRAMMAFLPDLVADDDCVLAQTDWPVLGGNAPAMRYVEARGGGHSISDPDPPIFSSTVRAIIGNQCRERHGVDMAVEFFDSLPD